MSISTECKRAAFIPFQHKRPILRIILSQQSKLVYSLIVAKPASAAGCGCIDWGQQIVLPAPAAAIILGPAGLHQRAALGIGQIVKAARLIGGNPYEIDAILPICCTESRLF